MTFLERIAPYRKSVVGFLVPGLVVLGTALADGHVDATEWVAILLAALGGGGAVYVVPNASRPPTDPPGVVGGTTRYDDSPTTPPEPKTL